MDARRIALAVFALAAAQGALIAPASADLQLCNRLSYVVDTAIGLENTGAAATRGWFRMDPGQCRVVLQGTLDAQHLYLYARALPLYGPTPLPANGNADLCIDDRNFVIAGAANACKPGQHTARFTEIKPVENDQGILTANLAEEAEYTDATARLAGIQRLLVLSGYDANPIDGVTGPRTEAAIAQFLKDHDLPAEGASADNFFEALATAAESPDGAGFSWCNDTQHTVMAAIGTTESGAIVTRGWYRVEPGRCMRPDLHGATRRIYSYGEASDATGRVMSRGGRPLSWGGGATLCTRDTKFEINSQKDCVANGLNAVGFTAVDLTGKGSTVRFKE